MVSNQFSIISKANQMDLRALPIIFTYLIAKCVDSRPRHIVAEVPSHHFLAFLVDEQDGRGHLKIRPIYPQNDSLSQLSPIKLYWCAL